MSKKKRKKSRISAAEKKKADRKTSLSIFLCMIAMVIPLALFIFFMIWLNAPNSGFLAIGILGALITGVGLMVLVVGLFESKDCSGILLILPVLGFGIILMALSLCIVLIPAFYGLFSEKTVTYYFVQGCFLALTSITYINYRLSLFQQLRDQGNTRKELKTMMKGMANYWWYNSLRGTHLPQGHYYLNKAFVCTYFPALMIHTVIGWWKWGAVVAVGLFCISCVCGCMMSIYSTVQWTEEEFGYKFVLLAHKGKHKKWYGYSSVGSIIGSCFAILSLAVFSVKLVIGLF